MIQFRVYGIPQTKGSTKAFMRPGMKYPIITNDNVKNQSWASTVTGEAQRARAVAGLPLPFRGVVVLTLRFHMPTPQRVKRGVFYVTTRPDLDKMIRSVKDALTGVFYLDDAQVAVLHAEKCYSDQPGVTVQIEGQL